MRRISPREAKRLQDRMMKQMGVRLQDVPNVLQVIIKTAEKEIILENPSVTVFEVQGQKIFQLTGQNIAERAIVMERKIAIRDEDVQLVASQTGKPLEEARKALEETEGDLARAILFLQSKNTQ
ncbi:nascent polypeptide-associated complex protein [Candidatus Bathyarchaeota archaeon]|nr:nascent polypeptide-associated complex protein [Candidatus Bathyarchaeota archaeon]